MTHIARMGAFERYPSDSHDGAIVLRSVLRLLDAELSPTKPSPLGSTPGPQLKETLQRVLGWMDIVCISIRKINDKDAAMLATFTGIYQENPHHPSLAQVLHERGSLGVYLAISDRGHGCTEGRHRNTQQYAHCLQV